MQVTGTGHHGAGQIELVRGLDFPQGFAFPPLGPFHALIETDAFHNAVALGGVAHIVENFRLAGKSAGPVGFWAKE